MANLIASYLKSVIDINDAPRYDLKKSHVFYSINKSLVDKVSIDDKMNIFYHFEEIKKILDHARRNHINLAYLTLSGLEKRKSKYSNDLAEVGMEAIHLPMLAYLDFVSLNFGNAESHLRKSISLFKILIDNNVSDCKIAALEQHFNLFKVYINVNRIEDATQAALEIIKYSAGKPSELIDFQNLDRDNIHEQLDVLHFYINGILKVLFFKSRKDTSQSSASKQEIIELLNQNISLTDLDNILVPSLKEMLLYVTNQQPKHFSDLLNLVPLGSLFQPKVPSFVQFLLLRSFVSQAESAGYTDYELQISKDYAKQILNQVL